MSSTKIKICGLKRIEDIECVNEYKPDYIGFIFWPKSHRYISFEKAKELKSKLNKDIASVGVFVDEDIEVVIEASNAGAMDIIQLHGNESEEYIEEVKKRTNKPVIKAVKAESSDIFTLKKHDDSAADFLLVDSGMGSGKTFDWTKELASEIAKSKKHVFIAGGIDSNNICKADELFKPYGIDLSSSVETDKIKDPEKIKQVIEKLRSSN